MKGRILIVDDDLQILASLRKVLQAEDYEVLLAFDDQEAHVRFDPKSVDLLLLDLTLPSRSGWDVFERFTALNPLLPVIIITGRDRQYGLAVGAGVGALMEKPLDVPLLLKTIADLLAEPAEERLKRLTGCQHSLLYFPSAAVSAATFPALRLKRHLEAQRPDYDS